MRVRMLWPSFFGDTEDLISVLDLSWGGNGSANYVINNGAR